MLHNLADIVKPHSLCGLPDVHQWLSQTQLKIQEALVKNVSMGSVEKLIENELKTLGRPLLENAIQQRANQEPLECPHCRKALQVEAHRRYRQVDSMFGSIGFKRSYGLCLSCQKRFYPADVALGLQERAPASPRVQEICALMVLESPAGQAQENVRRLTGLEISQAGMHREARRQGERALAERKKDMRMTQTLQGVVKLTTYAQARTAPFTLVIEIDAWNIRERDDWGKTAQLRKKGEDPSRWHWVYTGTVFRLDHRGKTSSGRAVITERGYVATRQGIEFFEQQLYAESLRRGFSQANRVLILADGAVWIWNIANNRFKDAHQRLDFWHVKEHLWTVARDLHGEGTPEAQAWIKPHLRWLEQRQDGALNVIHSLEQIRAALNNPSKKESTTLDREINYFKEHQSKMDYKKGKALNEPIGSGAIESTCSQYQCRFKRTGQFWSLEGDEAFLALATLQKNKRWKTLFPHDST